MNTAIIVFLVTYTVITLASIVVSIWDAKLRCKYQEENDACIYAMYRELKRYNDNLENQKQE